MEDALINLLEYKFGTKSYKSGCTEGIIIDKENLILLFKFLRDDAGFNYLRDISAVDWFYKKRPIKTGVISDKRFDLLYQAANLSKNQRVTVKVLLYDGEKVPTLFYLYPSANFLEREVYDLMGIEFEGHPDLRRILLSDDWQGHPLRKDYPISGYEMWDWKAHR